MLFLLTISLLLATTQATYYTDCGSQLGAVQKFSLSGCNDDDRICVFKRNSNITIDVDFTPSTDVKELQAIVHGIIMNLPVPFPLPQPDACKNSGLTCPLKSGEPALYQTSLPILKSYPKVKVGVKLELQNSEGEDFVCILISARIN